MLVVININTATINFIMWHLKSNFGHSEPVMQNPVTKAKGPIF